MTSEEFHSHVLQIVKRCQFPCQKAEEGAVRDVIFIGMNSQWARDKAINLMNEEGKEVTVEFLMNHLAVEDGNTQHKFLSQINSSSSVNMIAYNRRQNRGKSNRPKRSSGKGREQNKTRVQTTSSTTQPSRKPPRYGRKVYEMWVNQSTSQVRNVQPRMPSAKTATRLGTSTRYASPARRQEEPI